MDRGLLRRKADAHSIDSILEADTMLAETIDSWFEEATRKGFEEGYRLGFRLGFREGYMKQASKQLERRFGPLPQAVSARLAGATEAQLEAWGEAVLTAPTLDAVFSEGRH